MSVNSLTIINFAEQKKNLKISRINMGKAEDRPVYQCMYRLLMLILDAETSFRRITGTNSVRNL